MMVEANTVSFINTSLGFQTATKAIHWKTLGNAEHLYCDEFFEKLVDFTDKIVESASSIWKRPNIDQIVPEVPSDVSTLTDLVSTYIDHLSDYISYLEIVKDTQPMCRGLISICDDFMNELNITLYRSNLA